jgi:hypothetical protein
LSPSLRGIVLSLCVLGAQSALANDSFYVDASLEPTGKLLGWQAVDGLPGALAPLARDLVLAVRTAEGRELRVHALRSDGIDPTPRHTVPMLKDVIAWGVADVRAEEGKELLLLTQGGAWSYSLLKEGYRGNAAALAKTELIYDLPNPHRLPYWAFVLPGPEGKSQDRVLLPGREGYAIWSESPTEPGVWKAGPLFTASAPTEVRKDEDQPSDEDSDNSVDIDLVLAGNASPFLDHKENEGADLLHDSLAYRAPAMLDVDGDGRLDLLAWTAEGLAMHSAGADEPGWVRPLPEYLNPEDTSRDLTLADLDGDGDLDVLAKLTEESSGLEDSAVRLLILLQEKGRFFPSKPNQVLRFNAAEMRTQVTDVNGDGRPDLVIRKFELPSLLESVSGLEFTFTHLVYFGNKRGFERKPAVKNVEVYDEDSVAGAIANYKLVRDCDGDGNADLVALDLEGRLSVRRVTKKSSFFGGDSWSMDEAPWKLFDTRGAIKSLSVPDLNGDGLGDLVSLGSKRLTVYLSQRRRGSR